MTASLIQNLEQRILFALYGQDTSFGAGGLAPAAGGEVLEVLPDGKILAAGAVRLPSRDFDDLSYESTVSKLNADGTLDTSFGTRGIVDFGGEFPFVVTANTSHFFVVTQDGAGDIDAYTTANGTLDTTFSGDGILPLSGYTRAVNGVTPS